MRLMLMLVSIFWASAYFFTKDSNFIVISSLFTCTLAIVTFQEKQNESK